MPVRAIPGSDLTYALVLHDANGDEVPEASGDLLSGALLRQLLAPADAPITDVFITSHGWKGDVPAAIAQYDAWTATMVACEADQARMRELRPDFRPLVIGLHWPSQPWGDESPGGAARSHLLGNGPAVVDDAVGREDADAWAERIAGSPVARAAIAHILAAGSDSPFPIVSAALARSYCDLLGETPLARGDVTSAPGMNQEAFDPQAIVDDYVRTLGDVRASVPTRLLGRGAALRDALLSPLRQLSFWSMKDRARRFGEGAAHSFVRELQRVAPKARIHLMGHSFGCIVVCGAVAGRGAKDALARPVESLFLVQGALSLWAFASANPFRTGRGYFAGIHERGCVAGPILTTRSQYDLAVGRFYPLGAGLRRQSLLDPYGQTPFPRYGGLGAFGIQGMNNASTVPMLTATQAYDFRPGALVNLEASAIIREGGGAAGAHNDIAHPEVAHAFWSAAMARLIHAWPAGSSLGRPAAPDVHRVAPAGSADRAPAAASPADPSSPGWPSARPESYRTLGGGGSRPSRYEPGSAVAPATDGSAASFEGGVSSGQADDGRAAAPALSRWLHARVEGAEGLVVERWAVLNFDVGREARTDVAAQAELLDEALFTSEEAEASLTIQLDSADFDLLERVRVLRVPRAGVPAEAARFALRPLHPGRSELDAIVHKDGNFLHQFRIVFDVDGPGALPVETVGRGRSMAGAAQLQPRTLGLLLAPIPGGYDCTVWGAVCGRARLPVTPAQLATAIEGVRQSLERVIQYRDSEYRLVFQDGLDIPEDACALALAELARAGVSLFRLLFFGPGSARDAQHVGQFLRETLIAEGPPITLQVLGEAAPVPWGLLYLGSMRVGAPLDWNAFLGMRHVVENLPLQNELAVHANAIPSNAPRLDLGVFMNDAIDIQMRERFVARQRQFFSALAAERQTLQLRFGNGAADLKLAVTGEKSTVQIVYLFCHASAAGLADGGGPEAAALYLDGDFALTLGELRQQSDEVGLLAGQPLVFINACESAQLSPAFYDGFVPFLMSRGARGVIGTECRTPAVFAEAWAQRFFPRFLDGEPLGEVFLALRREFLRKHGNPLGLLYAVHCDGDTAVTPAASTSAQSVQAEEATLSRP